MCIRDRVKAIAAGGKTIIKTIPNRFYKSLNDLNISIKDSTITIKNTNEKELLNNKYLPPVLINGYHNTQKTLFNKFRNLIIKNLLSAWAQIIKKFF